MSCDILDPVADEIRSNKARVTLQLDESADVSNCTYLLVYCRYIHALELNWKIEFFMCKSQETTSEVTNDQEKMNNFFQQNKLVETRWPAMIRRRLFYAQWSYVLQLWWINGHCTSFQPLVFFTYLLWWRRVKPFQNFWKWFWNS